MIKFPDGNVTKVERAENNTFKCKCGKSFMHPESLRRHAKNCRDELVEQEEEVELMDIDDSDASELIGMDDRVLPVDCIGMQISREKADYR